MVRPKDIVYLDNNATTRVAPEVFEAMVPYLTELFGNPSSIHTFGSQVGKSLARAREQVATLVGCDPAEIVFTSCGTESDNTAIDAALRATNKRHVVTSRVEHSALIKQCDVLEARGFRVTYLGVDSEGRLDPAAVEAAIRPDTAIVSLMWANNETGVLFPIEEVSEICKRKGVLLHTDAVQAAGKVPIDLGRVRADMLSLSGHKIHAPKGVGALFVRKKTPFAAMLLGGGQERGRRGGTENVASIVAFGAAAELALANLAEMGGRIRTLRDRLESEITRQVPNCRLNGAMAPRLPNTSNISFEKLEAEALLLRLDRVGICASSGSACTTGSLEPSRVLTAMGLDGALARGSIRLSLSNDSTDAEITQFLAELPPAVEALRGFNPSATPSAEITRSA